MNNKGQTLVLFILLLPILFIFILYVISKCYLLYNKKNLTEIANTICNYALKEDDTNKITNLALENDSDINKVDITRKNNKVTITITKDIESLLNKTTIKVDTTCSN